jgi:hypothetical protein
MRRRREYVCRHATSLDLASLSPLGEVAVGSAVGNGKKCSACQLMQQLGDETTHGAIQVEDGVTHLLHETRIYHIVSLLLPVPVHR